MSYCDDCIILDICGKDGCCDDAMTFCSDKHRFIHKSVIEDIKAEITEKTGHWITYDIHGHKACKCSECNNDVGYPCNDKYCKHCGARMVEPQESEVEK